MIVTQLINEISNKIAEKYSQEIAWLVLETITSKTKIQLLSQKNIELNQKEQDKLDAIISQILHDKPIQYIIGQVPFLDLTIFVQEPILIPRPETEFWCNLLIQYLKKLENKNLKILDMCTGSGCIGLALANALPQAQVTAVDISVQALDLAKKNAAANNLKNITFIQSDLFENLTDLKFDLIVSNPPYIDEKMLDKLDASVKNWEDINALIAKDSGLFLIKEIIKKARNFLTQNCEIKDKNLPQLVIEFDINQAQEITNYLISHNFSNINIIKDLTKRDRVAFVRS